jgi:hypothetical protein
LKLQQLFFFSSKAEHQAKQEMSSGEESFHNLFESFSFRKCNSRKAFRWHSPRRWKIKRDFHVLYGEEERKTSQNFNPAEIFSLCSQRLQRRLEDAGRALVGKRKNENEMEKGKIIILLCYSEHVRISFHYALNAPCAYYAFLIRRREGRRGRSSSSSGSSRIRMWIQRGEANFLQRMRNVIYFAGKMKMSVRRDEIYGASSLLAFRGGLVMILLRIARLLLSSSAPHPAYKK